MTAQSSLPQNDTGTQRSKLIDGKAIAAKVRGEVAAAVSTLGRTPCLAVVLVGDDPASHVYVRNKQRACAEVGIESRRVDLPAGANSADVLAAVKALNADASVHGILVQLPLPGHVDTEGVVRAVSPLKDVDGFHPENVGLLAAGAPRFVSCTPLGVMRLLAEVLGGRPLDGLEAVVLGRSRTVGQPMALLLTQANATVTVCHSRTRDLREVVRRADVLVAAVGRPELVRGDWLRPGVIVIDVGINRLPDGRLVGDVATAEALEVAAAITPVPGGVGPMTIALLLSNTLRAAEHIA